MDLSFHYCFLVEVLCVRHLAVPHLLPQKQIPIWGSVCPIQTLPWNFPIPQTRIRFRTPIYLFSLISKQKKGESQKKIFTPKSDNRLCMVEFSNRKGRRFSPNPNTHNKMLLKRKHSVVFPNFYCYQKRLSIPVDLDINLLSIKTRSGRYCEV